MSHTKQQQKNNAWKRYTVQVYDGGFCMCFFFGRCFTPKVRLRIRDFLLVAPPFLHNFTVVFLLPLFPLCRHQLVIQSVSQYQSQFIHCVSYHVAGRLQLSGTRLSCSASSSMFREIGDLLAWSPELRLRSAGWRKTRARVNPTG